MASVSFLLNNWALCGKWLGDLLWLSLCRILLIFSAEQGRKQALFGVQHTIWINHASSTWPNFFLAEVHTLLMEVLWFQYNYLSPGSERKTLNAGVSSNKCKVFKANKWAMLRYWQYSDCTAVVIPCGHETAMKQHVPQFCLPCFLLKE